MDLLAVCSRPLLPSSNGSFIQPQRMDNRLHRASIGQQRDDDDYQCFRFAQTLKHRPLMDAKRLFTHLAFVSRTRLSVTDQVACSNLASCRAVEIRAK